MKNQNKELSNFSDLDLIHELEKRGHYLEESPSVIDVEIQMSDHGIPCDELNFEEKHKILMDAVRRSKTDVYQQINKQILTWIPYILK